MPDIKVIRIVVKGDDKDLDRSEKRIGNFGSNVSRVAGAMKATGAALTAGITGPLLGAAVASVKASTQFDQSLRNVDSMAHLSAGAFEDLRKSALAVANDPAIRQGPDDLAKALYQIYGSGFKGQQALEILKTSAYGASAGMTTTATATKVLNAVLNSGISGVTSARQAMDVLFQEVNIGVNNFEELAGSIGKVLPTAKIAGVSLQEVAAAIATMTKQGLSGAESVTSLNNLLVKIAKPTEKAKKVFEELGLGYGLGALQAKGLSGWLDDLNSKVGNNKQKMLELIPELRGMRGELLLATDNAKMYKDALANMENASKGAGATAEAYLRQNKGLAAQFEILTKEATLAGMELAESLMPTLRSLVEITREGIRWFRDLPEPIKVFGIVAATTAAAIGPLLTGLGNLKLATLVLAAGNGPLALVTANVVALDGAAAAAATSIAGPVGLAAAILAVGAALLYTKSVNEEAKRVTTDASKSFTRTAEERVRAIRSEMKALESLAEARQKGSGGGGDAAYLAAIGGLYTSAEQQKMKQLNADLSEWTRRMEQARKTEATAAAQALKPRVPMKAPTTPLGQGGSVGIVDDAAKKEAQAYRDQVIALQRQLTALRAGDSKDIAQLVSQYATWSHQQAINIASMQDEIATTLRVRDARKALSDQIVDMQVKIKDFKAFGKDAFATFFEGLPEGADKGQASVLYNLKQDLEAMTTAAKALADQQRTLSRAFLQNKIDALENTIKITGGTFAMWEQVTALKVLGQEYASLSTNVQPFIRQLALLESAQQSSANRSKEIAAMLKVSTVDPTITMPDGDNAAKFFARQAKGMTLVDMFIGPEGDQQRKLAEARKTMLYATADIFRDSLEQGGNFFDNLLTGWKRMLKQMAAQYITSQIFGAAIGGGAGPLGTLIGSIFGGFRAEGGPVYSHRAYMVGERGPELFVPGQDGHIANKGGTGSANVTVNLHGDVNNLGGLNQLSDQISMAVQSGLRYRLA